MSPRTSVFLAVLTCVLTVSLTADSDNKPARPTIGTGPDYPVQFKRVHPEPPRAPLPNPALLDTTALYQWNFDDGLGGPDPQGWITAEELEQDGAYFHVDDFKGIGGSFDRLIPIAGKKSMWLGARYATPGLCPWPLLPGYGNNWIQSLESVAFPIAGEVTLSFKVAYDIEDFYDWARVLYLSKTNHWNELAFIDSVGAGAADLLVPADSLNGSVRFRFTFRSDQSFSDEGDQFDTDGALILDDIVVTDITGVVNAQNFESEAVGAQTTNDGAWTATAGPNYGDFGALVNGASVLQEDPLTTNTTYFWSFYNGSTVNYACGGHPEQTAIPYSKDILGTPTGLRSEIRSPVLSPPTGYDGFILSFDVYRDLPVDNLVFYTYRVRSLVSGCWTPWIYANSLYGGPSKDWYRFQADISNKMDPNATSFQVAIQAGDYCPEWCGIYGSGACHSHSPLIDNVAISAYGDFNEPPAIDFANPATLQVEGTLQSSPSTNYTIRVYASPACDPSGSGPGNTLLGSTPVTTDSDGYAHYVVGVSSMPAGQVLTATSTDGGSTVSAFSKCFAVPAVHTVTNTATSGAGSLNQAVVDANANANASVITFNIPGAGPHSINIAAIPQFSTRIALDGMSQPGATRNTAAIDQACNAVQKIVLNGGAVFLAAPNCVLRNVALQNAAAVIQSVDHCRIEGCYIGTDATGLVAASAVIGVDVSGGSNVVGGRYSGARNVIAASTSYGVRLSGGLAKRNQVMGNFIGVSANGSTDLGSVAEGILVQNGPNTIGGASSPMRNVIAGNNGQQIDLRIDAADSVRVEGNYIGVDCTATALVETGPMALNGVNVAEADYAVIKSNVIGGQMYGVRFTGATTGTLVHGNHIGTNPSGTGVFTLGANGIAVASGTRVQIGGTNVGEGNVVANAALAGITVQGATTVNNPIRGNRTFANGGLGIDLGTTGVTPNDANDADTGPNNLQNFPVLTSAGSSGGITTIRGSIQVAPGDWNKLMHIEFFTGATCDGSGNGEGSIYLGSRPMQISAAGSAQFASSFFTTVPLGAVITATATLLNGSLSNTSEYSACVTVVNAPAGPNVETHPVDTTTGTTPVTMTFANIVTSGNTTLTTGLVGPPVPGTFQLTDPAMYYNITTTAGWAGNIEVCVHYDESTLVGPESAVRLLHYDSTLARWKDITTDLNTSTNTVCGNTVKLSPFAVVTSIATGVGNDALPNRFALLQNIPNPFNPTTVIAYDVPSASHVSLRIYDVSGQLVRTLVDEHRPAGHHTVRWDGTTTRGTQAATGVYFYRMTAGSFTSTRKMVLLK